MAPLIVAPALWGTVSLKQPSYLWRILQVLKKDHFEMLAIGSNVRQWKLWRNVRKFLIKDEISGFVCTNTWKSAQSWMLMYEIVRDRCLLSLDTRIPLNPFNTNDDIIRFGPWNDDDDEKIMAFPVFSRKNGSMYVVNFGSLGRPLGDRNVAAKFGFFDYFSAMFWTFSEIAWYWTC